MENDMNAVVEEFLTSLRIEGGLATNTLMAYRRDLRKLSHFLEAKEVDNFLDVSRDHFQEFLHELRSQQLAAPSVARCLAAIRGLYRFLGLEQKSPGILAPLAGAPKRWSRLPKVLSEAEVTNLLELPLRRTPEDLRDAAMVELLYATGLRVSELIYLEVSHVNREVGYVLATGKRDKQRVVPLGDHANQLLVDYVNQARPKLLKKTTVPSLISDQTWSTIYQARILENVAGTGFPGRYYQVDFASHAPPFLCHPSFRTWS